MGTLAPAYAPRRPTETVLYGAVRSHLETFLAHTRETYEKPLPRYVEKEFRSFLKCGVFAHGFARCRCESCGHDLLVAFSCKLRGICPSCSGRRMANGAAHLVDRVLPDVPVRQFVLSLPFELRRLAAFKPAVLTALTRIFVETVFASYRARAKREGLDAVECGALTFVQRFGGSLNLNVHFHTVFLDGVLTRDEQGRVVFHPAPSPDAAELQAIVRRVHKRCVAWLRRHGHFDERPLEQRSNEAGESDAIGACAAIAMQRGAFAKLPDEDGDDAGGASDGASTRPRFTAEHEGFNLHAGVHIAAGDDMGRERLCRYGLRPAMSIERLRRLRDGRIALRVKYASAGRAKHRVMTPLELLARLSAIIPPPRFPLLRYHGVLAPNSPWRKDVVPKPRVPSPRCSANDKKKWTKPTEAAAPATTGPGGSKQPRSARTPAHAQTQPSRKPSTPSVALQQEQPTRPAAGPLAPILLASGVLSVHHWDRLLDGLLYAVAGRLNWQLLLQRTFAIDLQQCPKCHGRMRVISAIHEPDVASAILGCLGMPTDVPGTARARDPTDDDELDPPGGDVE